MSFIRVKSKAVVVPVPKCLTIKAYVKNAGMSRFLTLASQLGKWAASRNDRFFSRIHTALPTGYRTGWSPEPAWKWWWREIITVLVKIRTAVVYPVACRSTHWDTPAVAFLRLVKHPYYIAEVNSYMNSKRAENSKEWMQDWINKSDDVKELQTC
jgi:hypothetical protein